ncbi:hypothetical protein [Emcibacter sp. SYSU 3D8]
MKVGLEAVQTPFPSGSDEAAIADGLKLEADARLATAPAAHQETSVSWT